MEDGKHPPHTEGKHRDENDGRNAGVEQSSDEDCRASLSLEEDDYGQDECGEGEEQRGRPASGVELA